jgi:hypothetical protein
MTDHMPASQTPWQAVRHEFRDRELPARIDPGLTGLGAGLGRVLLDADRRQHLTVTAEIRELAASVSTKAEPGRTAAGMVVGAMNLILTWVAQLTDLPDGEAPLIPAADAAWQLTVVLHQDSPDPAAAAAVARQFLNPAGPCRTITEMALNLLRLADTWAGQAAAGTGAQIPAADACLQVLGALEAGLRAAA